MNNVGIINEPKILRRNKRKDYIRLTSQTEENLVEGQVKKNSTDRTK